MFLRLLSPEDQSALADRIRRGDPAAEDELARAMREPVYFMLAARVGDREAASDLTQEVFIAVLLALRQGQVRQTQNLAAFVHGTARNLANNHLRVRNHQKGNPISVEAAVSESSSVLEEVERLRLVRKALARLDLLDRKILLFTLADGLKPGEIATRLDLSPEVVRARKSRALKKVIEFVGSLSRTDQADH